MNFANPANLVIAGVYFVLVAILTFFSIFGVYILIRYGQSRSFALSVALVFSFLFLNILFESYKTLNSLMV